MKQIDIYGTINGLDNIAGSDVVAQIWRHYAPRELVNKISIIRKIARGEVTGYLEKTDPEKNYGKDFNLYYIFQNNSDGVWMMNKFEASSVLCNGSLKVVNFNKAKTSMHITNPMFENSPMNRAEIARTELIVTKIS